MDVIRSKFGVCCNKQAHTTFLSSSNLNSSIEQKPESVQNKSLNKNYYIISAFYQIFIDLNELII